MRYRKKQVEIEAIRLEESGENINECYLFVHNGKENQGNFPETGMGIDPSDGKFKITTLEGVMTVSLGDFIIKGIKGEFYPCRADIFDMTYEPISEGEPKNDTIYKN